MDRQFGEREATLNSDGPSVEAANSSEKNDRKYESSCKNWWRCKIFRRLRYLLKISIKGFKALSDTKVIRYCWILIMINRLGRHVLMHTLVLHSRLRLSHVMHMITSMLKKRLLIGLDVAFETLHPWTLTVRDRRAISFKFLMPHSVVKYIVVCIQTCPVKGPVKLDSW